MKPLIERLEHIAAELRLAFEDGVYDEGPEHAATIQEAIAALSVAPAPVAGEPVAWRYRFSPDHSWRYVEYELQKVGMEEQPLYTSPPVQEGPKGVEPFKYFVRFPDGEEEYFDGDDKERLAEVLQDDAAVNYVTTPVVTPLYTSAQSIPAAPCQCKLDETTGWTDDDIMVPRCNVCGLVVMKVIAERKAERLLAGN